MRRRLPEETWTTVKELANALGMAEGTVRNRLNSIAKKDDDRIRTGAGPQPTRYRLDYANEALDRTSIAPADLGMTEVAMRVFGRGSNYDGVMPLDLRGRRGASGEGAKKLPLVGILASRKDAHKAYEDLLADLLEKGAGLRIRALSGKDFFDTHMSGADSLAKRFEGPTAKDKEHLVRVQLLYPLGEGARTRANTEGEKSLYASQFLSDALGTFRTINSRSQAWNIEVRWSEKLPFSFLVWTEELALVETYDHGKSSEPAAARDSSGCIGRNAPVSVVRGRTPYHELLKDGFDREFAARGKNTAFTSYSRSQVAAELKSHPKVLYGA